DQGRCRCACGSRAAAYGRIERSRRRAGDDPDGERAMSVAGATAEEMQPREFRLRNFLIASIALHVLLFLSALLTFGGIFGGPGPGGGESVTFQLAAGSANDRYAAPDEPVVEPEPQPEPERVKPPEPKPEAAVRKDAKPLPPPEEIPEPVQETVKPAAPAGGGVQDGMAGGAG